MCFVIVCYCVFRLCDTELSSHDSCRTWTTWIIVNKVFYRKSCCESFLPLSLDRHTLCPCGAGAMGEHQAVSSNGRTSRCDGACRRQKLCSFNYTDSSSSWQDRAGRTECRPKKLCPNHGVGWQHCDQSSPLWTALKAPSWQTAGDWATTEQIDAFSCQSSVKESAQCAKTRSCCCTPLTQDWILISATDCCVGCVAWGIFNWVTWALNDPKKTASL